MSKRHTLVQILSATMCTPTFLLAVHAYKHFDCNQLLMPTPDVRIVCLIAILRQNTYMHERTTILEFAQGKYQNQYTFWICKPVKLIHQPLSQFFATILTQVDPTLVTIPYWMTPWQSAGVSYMAFNLPLGQPTQERIYVLVLNSVLDYNPLFNWMKK